ncbi:MAG TPA: hypothetical protein VHQ47_15810 [Phycisphaerae bacterium]|jgi:hypothetical protein|nr:hypothetical protein [Phycisphaerae bacterium]
MAVDAHVEVSFDGETMIEFPSERVTASALVTRVGEDLYRLEAVPMVESAGFRNLIEADRVDEKKLRFRRVVQKPNWRVFDLLLARGSFESEKIQKVLRHVEEVGGHWERVFGGLLFICLSPDVAWDPTVDVIGRQDDVVDQTGGR